MRASIGVRNGVGKAEDLIVVAVVILQHEIHKHVVFDLLLVLVAKPDPTLAFENNRFGMQELLVFAHLPDELLDAELIQVLLVLRRFRALVGEIDLQPGIEKGQFTQTRRELRKLKLGRDVENRRIRAET